MGWKAVFQFDNQTSAAAMEQQGCAAEFSGATHRTKRRRNWRSQGGEQRGPRWISKRACREGTNFACGSMLTNSSKSNWTLEELQWTLHPEGDTNGMAWRDGSSIKFISNPPCLRRASSILLETFVRTGHGIRSR